MTDTKELEKRIKDSGLKKKYICEALNLSYQGFMNKVTNINFFNTDEVKKLCKLLNISTKDKERIFFND